MPSKLPEDPSRYMEDAPSSNPLATSQSRDLLRPEPATIDDAGTGEVETGEPPVSPDERLDPQNPFSHLDDDEQNDFDEDAVLTIDSGTPD